MRSSILKKIRQAVALAVFIVFCVIFLDYRHLIPEKYFDIPLWFQFVPSAIKFVTIGVVAGSGFLAVLLLTILTGRTYCSFLCPLGILQDLFSRIGGKIKRRFKRFGFKRPHTVLRYSLLAVTVLVVSFGGIYVLSLLDPYSIFGRFATYFAKPVILALNNFLSVILEKFDVYTIAHVQIPSFSALVYIIPAGFLLLVGILSITKGRLYCNSICPVGTFLGLISKISLLRIKFDESKCTKCGRCAIACKSFCIDFLNKKIDNSRCVECFNCINSCPDKALSYSLVTTGKKKTETDSEKRNFIGGLILILTGLSVKSLAQEEEQKVEHKASTVKEKKTFPVSPPGSTGIENFNSKCTACSLCISACPNNVLVPSLVQYGITGIMQPHMDYHKGFCAYECTRCLEICPTGAIMPLELEAKKLTKIGTAIFVRDNCIVETERTACGACAESCPTKAVHMVPFEGNLTIPETNDEICIGCGHCEFACPVVPYKAIYVDGIPVHKAAKKPENVQTDLKHEDFPF